MDKNTDREMDTVTDRDTPRGTERDTTRKRSRIRHSHGIGVVLLKYPDSAVSPIAPLDNL